MAGYGAAGVIFDTHGRVLLVRESHPEWEPEQEPYVPPGGTVEAGETPREAAEREIFEECGVVAKAGELLGVYVSKADDWFAFGFLAQITAGVPAVPGRGRDRGGRLVRRVRSADAVSEPRDGVDRRRGRGPARGLSRTVSEAHAVGHSIA